MLRSSLIAAFSIMFVANAHAGAKFTAGYEVGTAQTGAKVLLNEVTGTENNPVTTVLYKVDNIGGLLNFGYTSSLGRGRVIETRISKGMSTMGHVSNMSNDHNTRGWTLCSVASFFKDGKEIETSVVKIGFRPAYNGKRTGNKTLTVDTAPFYQANATSDIDVMITHYRCSTERFKGELLDNLDNVKKVLKQIPKFEMFVRGIEEFVEKVEDVDDIFDVVTN